MRARRVCSLWLDRGIAFSARGSQFDFQPVGRGRAGIAIAAELPLGNFAEVAADVALPALFGLHETLDFVVALPGAVFFTRILDFADKKGAQTGVSFVAEVE